MCQVFRYPTSNLGSTPRGATWDDSEDSGNCLRDFEPWRGIRNLGVVWSIEGRRKGKKWWVWEGKSGCDHRGLVPGLPPDSPHPDTKIQECISLSYKMVQDSWPSLGGWGTHGCQEPTVLWSSATSHHAPAPQLPAYFPSNLWSSFHPDFRRCHVQT